MMNSSDSIETRRVLFHGRVQGVFFRKTTESYATSLPVKGYVRNLDDGSVELVASGSPETLETLLERILTHYRSNISNWESVRLASTESFEGFEIR